jgi:hypothetical protein
MNEAQIPLTVKLESHIINTGIINISMEFCEQEFLGNSENIENLS